MSHVDASSTPPDGRNDPRDDADALPPEGDATRPDEGVVEPAADDATPAQTPEEEAQARAAALEEKLKRVEAGFVNETKRIRRQAEQDRKYAIEKVVEDLLPVVDALGSAQAAIGEGESAGAMREGLLLVEKQLASVLERYGVSEIEALGQPFDPARHQAMMMVDHPDFAPQTVCEVLRAGYELNGRIVRAAEVLVVKTPPAESQAADEEDA